MKNKAHHLIACAVAAFVGVANAQAVDVMRRSYSDAQPLPIAPAAGSGLVGLMATGAREWTASVKDGTVRSVLDKWSISAGWTFAVEHWTVNRDLPISADTTFRGDYRAAVRSLLASSELTDLPLQPCFYSNAVLRVVPRNEICDRMAAADR